MCLLAEVAYEHDEDFRSHLPLLFHAIMIAMDSPEPLVYHHAQQALVNLLYSLSARHLELHKNSGALLTEHHQVTSLIKYLQSMRSRRLWAYEDITLRHTYLASSTALAALVNAVTEAIFFESDLRERWAAEALKWMLECNSRHLACRSHQVCTVTHPEVFREWLASSVGSDDNSCCWMWTLRTNLGWPILGMTLEVSICCQLRHTSCMVHAWSAGGTQNASCN